MERQGESIHDKTQIKVQLANKYDKDEIQMQIHLRHKYWYNTNTYTDKTQIQVQLATDKYDKLEVWGPAGPRLLACGLSGRHWAQGPA